MFKCECGGEKFVTYIKKIFDIVIDGNGIEMLRTNETQDEISEVMDCEACGKEYDVELVM